MTHTALMGDRIDSPNGRTQYSQRLATVEPILVNLRTNKHLDRSILRGRDKVSSQW